MVAMCAGMAVFTGVIPAQQSPPAAAPGALVITLQDALARARQYGGQIQSANFAVLQAREDTSQARAARLPSVNAFNQFIYTEGNGTPSGVFVANDGVHIYNEQAVVHQEALALVRRGELNRALAAEAVARARVDVAARGLSLTVVQDYYAIAVAQRKYANAQTSVREAQRFFEITQQLEKGGEAAHSDVIRAQIDLQQRQRDLQEAQLTIDKSKIALGVLIFPNFSSEFSVVDDLQQLALVPPMAEVQNQAAANSPDLAAAKASIGAAGYDISVARYAYIPSLALDFFYGVNANQLAFRTQHPAADPELAYRQNLGYSAQATLNIPVWNWGATRSKIKQAEIRRDQAQLDLTLAQRTLQSNVANAQAEATIAQAQLESLRSSVDLAVESLRLTLLRYQAGEATAFEVVDSQNTVTFARNAYDDGLARYRVALTDLQILTGTL
jgi:outer membrane protein TolC